MNKHLEGIVEYKTLQILQALAAKPNKLFHIQSLGQAAKVPLTSTFRIIKRLKKASILEEQKIGKLSVYKLANNEKTSKLRGLL